MQNKLSFIYLIQEAGCLNPMSGAFQHIKMGMKYLAKDFEPVLLLQNKKINLELLKKDGTEKIASHVKKRSGVIKGTLKDFSIILYSIFSLFKQYKTIKKENPCFIYERASYLNLNGLIVAKLLNIPHFYEANGLQFESKRKYYKSLLVPLIRVIEKWQYVKSTHTFFVGTYGNYWKLKTGNWINVENGIEKEFIANHHCEKLNDGKIHLVFVGSLMYHHRPDILLKALNALDKSLFHVHLVGDKLEKLYDDLIKQDIQVFNHGFVPRNKLNALISQFHIGIIAGSPMYNSSMKLFDYAIAKLVVVAPKVDVLYTSFSKELCFFDGTANDMANKLKMLKQQREKSDALANLLYCKVCRDYTWDNVFARKINIIQNTLKK